MVYMNKVRVLVRRWKFDVFEELNNLRDRHVPRDLNCENDCCDYHVVAAIGNLHRIYLR